MTFYLQTTFSANCPSFSPFLWALDQTYESQWLPKPKVLKNYKLYFECIWQFLTLKNCEMEMLSMVSVSSHLNTSNSMSSTLAKSCGSTFLLGGGKNGLTDELRDHTPELEEAIDILWILLITILLPNWSGALEAPWRPRLPLYMTFAWAQAFLAFLAMRRPHAPQGERYFGSLLDGWFWLQLIF